jgi:hypothetical protein
MPPTTSPRWVSGSTRSNTRSWVFKFGLTGTGVSSSSRRPPLLPCTRGTAAEFLARNGDGLFSVVIRSADCDQGEQIAARYGTRSDLRQHVEGDGFEVTEVKLEPLFGIPLTLLTTNLP